MTRRLAALLALGLAACGADDRSAGLPLGIAIQGLTADQIGKVQVVVLSHGLSYSCVDLRSTCVRSKVLKQNGAPIDDLVKLRDAEGNEHAALLFDVSAGELVSSKGQTFQARMAPGSNYMVVVEVLSKDATPTLLASGCSNVIAQVGGGQNAPVAVKALARPEPEACDVVIEE